MDIRNMRQLLAIRRHGSFAKAAEALGMSQPSLSGAIARLEDQLKVRLFERSPTGSHLTPIGELLAERAGKVVAEAEQMVRDAALVAGGKAGTIRLGVGTGLRDVFLPRLVLLLAENYPGLDIAIEVLDRDRLLPLLKSRELDLIICALGEDVGPDDLVATEVLTTQAVAVAAPGHPLIGERMVSVDRFAEFPGSGTALKEFANARLLSRSEEWESLSQYRSNDYGALVELAMAGYATLVCPAFVVQDHVEAGRLARIDLDWTFRVTFAAIATRATSYSPIVGRIVHQAVKLGAALQLDRDRDLGLS